MAFLGLHLRGAAGVARLALATMGWLSVACAAPRADLTDAAADGDTADAGDRADARSSHDGDPAGPELPEALGPHMVPDASEPATAERGDADPAALRDAGDIADADHEGPHDADAEVAATRDGEVACESSLVPTGSAPALLSETGLYADIADKEVASPMWEFTPQFQLWSDGAQKSRWMYLPECDGIIDTLDMDNWSFPVGARAFKEFAVDGKRIETRMVHRFGPGPDDFLFAHYLWDDTESEGHLITSATPLAQLERPKGTAYTVPTVDTCVRCHGARGGESGGLPSRFLGFSAVQLSHDGPGQTMHTLSASRRLTSPNREGFRVPGTPLERDALGYLHANCGHCHNETDDAVAFPASPFVLWLRAEDPSLRHTGAYQTAVDVPPQGFTGDCLARIEPGDPGLVPAPTEPVRSCVFERASQRGTPDQMPPLATALVHSEGLEILRAWILSLSG